MHGVHIGRNIIVAVSVEISPSVKGVRMSSWWSNRPVSLNAKSCIFSGRRQQDLTLAKVTSGKIAPLANQFDMDAGLYRDALVAEYSA